ncbi:MAG: prefoldin subunit beta [Zestosphaera tikiterensis]|uniref:Prefoldin subunit beta n=1 Tax=Zestosphaera tikiterensis TaxID=1973259 RepID=A0A2R7Y4L6_9CREN|nr:MAG: prefoldin subunit beta [Zestosphaera tikiterensis]
MAQKIPPELEQTLIKYQQIESQLASVITQKSVVSSELKDIERALNVLQSISAETPVYKNTGFVLVKVGKDEVIKELQERKEELEVRLTSFEKIEETLRKQFEAVKKELEKYRVVPSTASEGG